MDSNWAAEHLQVIRTLMERSRPVSSRAGAGYDVHRCAGLSGAGIGLGGSGTIGSMICSSSWPTGAGVGVADGEPALSPGATPGVEGIRAVLVVAHTAGHPGPAAALLIGFVLPWCWCAILPGVGLRSATGVAGLVGSCCTAARSLRRGSSCSEGIKLLGWLFVFCGCALMATRCQAGGEARPRRRASDHGRRLRRLAPGLRHLPLLHRAAQG